MHATSTCSPTIVAELCEHEPVTLTDVTPEQVAAFLAGVHGTPVGDLEALDGGFWSSAFGYCVEDRDLVLRLGTVPEGFEMDRAAMAFGRLDLPIPEVLEIGEGLGRSYAISVRHRGRFLETVRPDEADVTGPMIVRTLAALWAVPAHPGAAVSWGPGGDRPASTWRGWLTDGLIDDPRRRVSGWRAALARDAHLDRLFGACEQRIGDLVEACPERRDLVHGDLLHGNVLVDEDGSRVTAMFSWKCSVRGDLLFDVAWCTFWGPWHPGIAAADVWTRVTASPSLPHGALVDAALRHHCYEFQIGATHLGWNAWTGDEDELRSVAAHIETVLERGPLERGMA